MITLVVGIVIGLITLALPISGLIIVMIMLYLPIFPNLKIGGFETSITGPLLLLLAGVVLLQRRKSAEPLLVPWQKVLLAGLALVFAITTIFSQKFSIALYFMPNLAIYFTGLFVTMAMIDSKERLILAAKATLILGFVRSIWGLELGPIRTVFGLPGLGVNASTFTFHPAFALSLVILITSGAFFSRRWRIFAGLTLISLVGHGFLFETRSAWAVWSLILIIITTRLPLRRWARFLPIVAISFSLIGIFYMDTLLKNLEQTKVTLTALQKENLGTLSNGDRVRRLAQAAGLRMFYEHPILGWGPNMFRYLRPNYRTEGSAADRNSNPFNAWLMVLVEMGLIGLAITALIVISPLLRTWSCLKTQDQLNWLAFGFALGAFGLAVHLLFIDQMYSFYWCYVGLALAAARLVVQPEVKIVRTLSSSRLKTDQKISISHTNIRHRGGDYRT